MAHSYYVATANTNRGYDELRGSDKADVCIVGGGCTGLSAALHLANAGLSTILVEGGRIGWGASGRNGGQLIPGLRMSALQLSQHYGQAMARDLFELSLQARTLVLDLIQRHRIRCDLKLTGHVTCASRPGDLLPMQREVDYLNDKLNYPHARVLDREEVRSTLDANYHGGLFDSLGGHLHPLNYTLALAEAASSAGARLYERTSALSLTQSGEGTSVKTEHGQIQASRCLLAGDALLSEIGSGIGRYIMPIASYIGVTKPLELDNPLIKGDRAISDTRFVVNYFRTTPDGRLLFGGGERYTTSPPRDMKAFVRTYMLRVFPGLKDVSMDYAWGGLVSVTRSRLPHVGRDRNVLYAHGYSGMGALLSTLAGKIIAQAALGDSRDLDCISRIAPGPFPGGHRLRPLIHAAAMALFAMRDKLGV